MDKKLPGTHGKPPLAAPVLPGSPSVLSPTFSTTTPTDARQTHTRHPSRKSQGTRQLLNCSEICSRFEQLSGRNGQDLMDGLGVNRRRASIPESTNTRQTFKR